MTLIMRSIVTPLCRCEAAPGGDANPTDSAFLNLTWNFYDENKIWRSITAAQVLNHESQLRYVYGPSKFLEMLPCLLDWIIIRPELRLNRLSQPAAATQKRLLQTLEKGGRVRVHIRSMLVPVDKSAVYRIYANPEAAKANEGPSGNGYLGSFPVVPNSLSGQHEAKRPKENNTRDVTIYVSKRIVELLSHASMPLKLTYVERGTKGDNFRKNKCCNGGKEKVQDQVGTPNTAGLYFTNWFRS
jgi:hypothetical protein